MPEISQEEYEKLKGIEGLAYEVKRHLGAGTRHDHAVSELCDVLEPVSIVSDEELEHTLAADTDRLWCARQVGALYLRSAAERLAYEALGDNAMAHIRNRLRRWADDIDEESPKTDADVS